MKRRFGGSLSSGSTGSRLLSGTHPLALELEERIGVLFAFPLRPSCKKMLRSKEPRLLAQGTKDGVHCVFFKMIDKRREKQQEDIQATFGNAQFAVHLNSSKLMGKCLCFEL